MPDMQTCHTEEIPRYLNGALTIAIHPIAHGPIIVTYPGFNEAVEGNGKRFLEIANRLSNREKLGAVVGLGNCRHSEIGYDVSVVRDLRDVIDHCLYSSRRICGTDEPQLYLMGYSAGASAVAATAAYYPQIARILLVAPSDDAGQEKILRSLGKFKGEIYSAVGANDEVVGKDAAEYFSSIAKQAVVNKSVVIPNCDHQFTGQANKDIFSALPSWAFANRPKGTAVPDFTPA